MFIPPKIPVLNVIYNVFMPSKKITIEIEEQTYSFFEYAYKR
jgi:hypothetical protein